MGKLIDNFGNSFKGFGKCAIVGVPAAALLAGLLVAVIVFLVCLELWIPGAVLISIADEKDTDDTKYLIGFILMLVAAGTAACGFLAGCCIGGGAACSEADTCCV